MTLLLASLRRLLVVALASLVPTLAAAQQADKSFAKEEIDQLTAQVALLPDALLAQVLMATTYPKDVAEAALWTRANPDEKGDAAVARVEDKPWDPSVQSLVAFPQVIVMMGDNPAWVRDLGDAFLLQPEDVMDSIQRLRAAAQRAGNLASNAEVEVRVETSPPADFVQVVNAPPPPPQVIVIEQRSPQVIFVPMYNPMIVFGTWWWPRHPPIFIPPPIGFWWHHPVSVAIWWGVGIGVTHAVWGRSHWWSRSVTINVHHHNRIHVRHPIDRWDPRGDAGWSHRPDRRRDVPYRSGERTRDMLQQRADRMDREPFRGRDVDRARAEQALRDRGIGTDRAALRDVDRDDLRRQAQALDTGRIRDLDRDAARDRAQGVNRDAARDRAQNIDRDAARDRARDQQRVPALQGVDHRQARAEIDRGRASRESVQRPANAAPQRARSADAPPVQRPAAGQGQRAAGAVPANRPQGIQRAR